MILQAITVVVSSLATQYTALALQRPTSVVPPTSRSRTRPPIDQAGSLAPQNGRNRSSSAELGALPHTHEDLLRNSLAYAIKRAQVRCDEALSRHLDAGLSPARFAALCAIGANPGISQAALGNLLGIAGPSVVKVVDELERMTLVTRMPTADRRVYALQLTQRGSADLTRYQSIHPAFEQRVAGRLSPREQTLLLRLLAKVATEES